MYLFKVKERISKNFLKIRPSDVLNKMAVLHQFKHGDAFVAMPTRLYFYIFFSNVRCNLTLVKAYSENLSIKLFFFSFDCDTYFIQCTGNESALTPVHLHEND